MPYFSSDFKVILPGRTGDFNTQWADCLDQLIMLMKGRYNRIIKMNIFLHSHDYEDFSGKRKMIENDLRIAFGEDHPAVGILPNSPAHLSHLAIEVVILNHSGFRIGHRKYKDWCYTVISKNSGKTILASGLGCTTPGTDSGSAARQAFEAMHQILQAENMSFDHIVRQWNYLGNILHMSRCDDKLSQRYQAFNEVRHEYYQKFRSVPGFPAATGIGMNYDGVLIDFIAVTSCSDLQIVSIHNPNQFDPYAYEQKVLVGDLPSDQAKKHPPMFDRAKLMVCGGTTVLFVSGTAAIAGQETIGGDDIRRQLEITIENIRSLASPENIRRHILISDQLKYQWIRVYIKHMKDSELVRSVCGEYFGDIPAIFLQADICRDDLLVEIEAQLRS